MRAFLRHLEIMNIDFLDVVICYKQRKKANVIGHMELIGDVKGKNVILVDDMIDTAHKHHCYLMHLLPQ